MAAVTKLFAIHLFDNGLGMETGKIILYRSFVSKLIIFMMKNGVDISFV